MTQIAVSVPDDRNAESGQFFGRRQEGRLNMNTSANFTNWNRNGEPWSGSKESLAAATWWWGKRSVRARDLFELLIDNPGQRFTGSEIAEQLGIKKGARGVAGILAWPGRYCIEGGYRLPSEFYKDRDSGAGLYWMKPTTAALFAKARIANGS